MSYVTDIFKGIHFSLFSLYVATFAMRLAAYTTIGLISYMLPYFERSFVIMFYSVTEILTVSYFGVRSDTRGRKGVLIIAHLLTTLGVALFMILGAWQGKVETTDLILILIIYFPLMGILGAGAASKVASTLTMIADESNIENRAQYMGFFDLATLGGFGVGLAAGHVLGQSSLDLWVPFFISLVIVAISLVMVYFWVNETIDLSSVNVDEKHSASDVLGRVLKVVKNNKDLQRILPVYIPIISLYGLIVAFAKELVDTELESISFELLFVGGLIAIMAGSSMLITGKMSDRSLIRRPFIIVGLICLAILIILLKYYPSTGVGAFEGLFSIWPIVAVLSFGFGAFPPAILAYLTDISKKDTRGTMFGVYSVIFGTGMIIGPFLGIIFSEFGKIIGQEIWGVVIAVIFLVASSIVGTLFLTERAAESKDSSLN
ncbi:MAG: MFS transporter [Candidatus Hodarchaeales archaeon]|jgi:MFS family permease